MRTNTVMESVRAWLLIRFDTLSRRRRAASVVLGSIVILALGLAAAHATQSTGRPQANGGAPSHTSTARPGRTVIADAGALPSPAPLASPLPTPTLGAITGAGARMRLFPRVAQHDLTLGNLGSLDVHTAKSVVFTPDPHYVAQDTLNDTGPGPPGPLSGLPTRPDLARRRPVAVVIDNFDPDARPQAGLNRASMVFETVAEGGITRFMAVYLEKDAPIVGPVRSARIYFDAWAAGLHAIYGHAGGNNDALAEIPRFSSLANVDGLGGGPPNPYPWDLYWRSTDRAAPHNLYTASDHLRAYADVTARGNAQVPIPSLPHKEPAALFVRPAGGTISIGFSTDEYSVQYRYDPHCNCYGRSMNGQPHLDAFSLRQIAPANVVVLYAGVVADPASDTAGSVNVQSRGSGRALYFRDGGILTGFWHKGSTDSPLSLLDGHGQPVAMDPGQTWIEVAPIGSPVQWQLHP